MKFANIIYLTKDEMQNVADLAGEQSMSDYMANAVREFDKLLDIAEQALSGVNFDNREVIGFAPLWILKLAVEYYR